MKKTVLATIATLALMAGLGSLFFVFAKKPLKPSMQRADEVPAR